MRYFPLLIIFLFLQLFPSCSKEIEIPLTFEEQIIGKWELREAIDRINYQDNNWHEVTKPFLSLVFNQDGTYKKVRDCTNIKEEGIFSVSPIDSIITIETVYVRWFKPQAFTGDSFVDVFMTDEGMVSHRYYKIE